MYRKTDASYECKGDRFASFILETMKYTKFKTIIIYNCYSKQFISTHSKHGISNNNDWSTKHVSQRKDVDLLQALVDSSGHLSAVVATSTSSLSK